MTNPGDSSGQGGQGSTPRNPGQAPRPRRPGEGSSGSTPPVPRQEPESSRPRIPTQGAAGRGTSTPISAGSGDVLGDHTAGGPGGAGSGSGHGSGGVAVLQIGGIVRRKRTRVGDAGAGPSRPVGNNPSPHPAPPLQAGQFVCNECRRPRIFDSHRALSGHMRTHTGREWRGVYPPPTFSRDEFDDDDVARGLLNPPLERDDAGGREEEGAIAEPEGVERTEETVAIVEEGEILDTTEDHQAVERGVNVGSRFDLNAEATEEEPSAGPSTSGEPKIPDLNDSPLRDHHGNYL